MYNIDKEDKMKVLSTRTFNRKIIELAYNYLDIKECQKCGSPVVRGNICLFCQDTNPSHPKDDK